MQNKNKQYSDDELVELFKSDQREYAFTLLMKKYQQKLYWHIRKIIISHNDTDDILQNTFIKIWKGLEGFRSDAQLFTWLYRIATNEALSFIKTKKRRSIVPLEGNDYNLSDTLAGDAYFCGDDAQKKLYLALNQLPEKQRLVFNLKYFEEMKYEDMAEILDTSVGALKASFHHAVKKIENLLNKD
jgi:RNA polymerase sigma-70 factor, ECF subfamily